MNSDEALGRYQLYESGMVEMQEAWKAGIDPETFGRKVREQDNGYFTDKGYVKVCPPQLNTAETVSYTWEAAKAHRSLQQTRVTRLRSPAGRRDTSCFARPQLTADWENKLSLVAKGELSPETSSMKGNDDLGEYDFVSSSSKSDTWGMSRSMAVFSFAL